ncbi:hypothetical protein PSEUBRA_002589 [Kalmanozyma brasiliensis GHG001]|uniref:uncharacterized protein n=1 Tax=Kalmanozyma brasiliensis (strain GHG001) TaxID=1365824 RepID=UPI0028683527|nr:uncharacterized protein PSEUBRA_002589 [Kalmanozyma brasiliensis GHG001]EST07510.2 hypothetical protein PSEUBRA_002589 [Kalmanozyma brasiliensis GHG001]
MPPREPFEAQSVGAPCATSLAWTSALIGGLTIRGDDLAPSMVLFFIALIFLVIGLLRTIAGRRFPQILIVFTPTLLFVFCLTIWSALRAHLSNLLHVLSFDATSWQSSLIELVAANGLVSCAPMMLCETTFQVFGLLGKRIAVGGRWIKYTAYGARLANGVALVMTVVAACDFASYLTSWVDQKELATVTVEGASLPCTTINIGRSLTLLPLMADGLELVVLFVLIMLTLLLRLRYRLVSGVAFHVITILMCLTLHFAWKCARDWSAFQIYLDGEWNDSDFPIDLNLEGLARRTRKGADDPMLFYLLGTVPLVLAMILIYTLDLVSYTNPPAVPQHARMNFSTRFNIFLDPTSPRIELLPTGKAGAIDAKKDAKGKGKEGEAAKAGEMYVVKRGWLGGWSVQPAQTGDGWMTKLKRRARQRVQSFVMGWSAEGAPAV